MKTKWKVLMPVIFKNALLMIAGMCFTLLGASCSKKSTGGGDVTTPPVNPLSSIKFTISGTKILDANGKEFIPVGINVNGPYWPWARPTIPDVPLITDIWKANSVRVQCWPEFSVNDNNNTDLDGIISAFTAKKVVTILEEHNFTGRYPNATELGTLTAWWVNIANKYKGNAYVWFNIMNEPGNSGAVPQDWLNDHDAVIKAIRGTGANNIIVCDEHDFGQANGFSDPTGSGALTYGTTLTGKYSNILFSLHLYDQWVYGLDRLNSYVSAIHAKNLALIFGEYGVGSDNSMEVATSVYKVAIANNIGRIGWQWTGVDLHKLTTTGDGGGFSIDNTTGAKPNNLSFVGNFVWDDLHGNLSASSTELTPPSVIAYNSDFEQGSPSNGDNVGNGWINFGTATIDATASNVEQGQFAVKVKAGSAGGCGEPVYLEPGATYKITAWGKNSIIPSSPSNIGLKYQNTFTGSQTQMVSLDFTETSYTQKTATFTAPAQLAEIFLFVYKNDSAPDFWCDNISIQKQ